MKKNYIHFLVIFIIIIICCVGLYSYEKITNISNKSVKITVYTLPEKEKVFINGIITPEKIENIFLDNAEGSVNKVSVTDGQIVKKGDILFRYKNAQITAQIDQDNQQISSNNYQKKLLLDKQAQVKNQIGQAKGADSATSVQINTYQDQIDSIQNQINTYRDQIKSLKLKEYTTITAPIDGEVILNGSEKDLTKSFIVIESTTFYIKGTVNEIDQSKLKENQSADILIFSTNKILTGKVSRIENRPTTEDLNTQVASIGSSSNLSYYNVIINLDSQENLTNGFHVQATVKMPQNDIKIPKNAILEEYGSKYVFKVVNKKLVKQKITYEESNSSEVVVSSGVQENDSIALNVTKDMKEGMSAE
jgi:HlyD family secretion protein